MKEFFTPAFAIGMITACICAVAFAVIFHVHRRHLVYAAICGLIANGVYYGVSFAGGDPLLAALISSVCAAVFSEITARLRHAPAALFLIPGVIPVVPGGDLYYSMKYLLLNDMAQFVQHLFSALKIGFGIALGILGVSVIVGTVTDRKRPKTETAGSTGSGMSGN